MTKELEAFENIKYKLSSSKANGYWEDLDILETALKDYETLKREHEFLREHYNELLKDYEQLKINYSELEDVNAFYTCECKDKLIALDVIKEKLDANTICRVFGYKGYAIIDYFKNDERLTEILNEKNN